MFGLNDEGDKNKSTDTASGNDLAAALDSGLASAALPPNDSAPPIPNPIVTPGSNPTPATVPADSAILPPAQLEAVPSPALPQENVAPPTAEATMPEASILDSLGLGDNATAEPLKTKKGGKKDDSKTIPAPSLAGTPGEDELLDIKQQALQSLTPLIDQLDQTAEEKFKTVMMLIQASDNADLVKEAYEAANQIEDEKARAQALLDVVNEINYFTQHQKDHSDTES